MRRTLPIMLRHHTRWIPGLCLVFAAGLLGGWLSRPAVLREHDGGQYSFRYPASLEVVHDSFEVATPDSTIVALRGADGTLLMVHSFAPASHLTAQQFAEEIARQRRRALVELGAGGGEVELQVEERVRSAGALRDAVRQEFEIESGGLRLAQLARYVRVESGDQELFLSLHAPAYRAAGAEDAFAEVLDSLEFAHPRTAANQSTRRDYP
jgi:hypothetical protein